MNKKNPKIDEQVVLDHLREKLRTTSQSSWDWQADLEFAEVIGDEQAVKDLQTILGSNAPWGLQISVHQRSAGHIKEARLKYLRKLEKLGEVQASWEGLGAGATNQFGVGRIRVFSLAKMAEISTQTDHAKS